MIDIEMVQDCGGTLSVVLAGHPKLKNDLRRSSLEEIGSRANTIDYLRKKQNLIK